MLTNQHVEVDHKLVDMSTSSVESLLAGACEGSIAPFNVSHAPWGRSLVSYTFCSCSDCASVRNAVQRDGREGAHGLGR